ncbi:MAG: GDSL-type esterase/lipase family protein [Pseudomonadota bacterium]
MKTRFLSSCQLLSTGLLLSAGITTIAFAQIAVGAKPIQIVAFGASQTAGKIVSLDQAYPAQLERRLKAEGFNVIIVNQGSSGDTTKDERSRLESAIPVGTNIVLFQPGTNDCGRQRRASESQVTENIAAMLSWMKDRQLQVLVLGGDCYEEVQATLPGKYGYTYYGKMAQGLNDFSRPDGQHFSAEGYTRMVDLLMPSVRKMVAELGTPTGKP